MKTMKRVCATAVAVGSISALAACGGGVAQNTSGGGDVGFEYGAEQSEVDAILADLEPVEIVYQAGASSPDVTTAASAHLFKEAIEERSNGQIAVDIVWGQAIASYGELDDALADGRVDIGFTAPPYQPNEYPTFDAVGRMSQVIPPSPLIGEMVSMALMTELGWESNVIDEYESKGLVPLAPAVAAGEYYLHCTEPGSGLDDLRGRQVRVATSPHHDMINEIGASPVFMEYAETYEALQRGTVDCVHAQLPVSGQTGITAIAPHISYATEFSFAGRASAGHIGGSGFDALPLAYKQIIFDADSAAFDGFVKSIVDTGVVALQTAQEASGTIEPLDAQVQEQLGETQAAMLDESEESGVLGADIEERARESAEKWARVAEELGYEEVGDLEEFASAYDPDEHDFRPFAEAVFEEVVLPHRPDGSQ